MCTTLIEHSLNHSQHDIKCDTKSDPIIFLSKNVNVCCAEGNLNCGHVAIKYDI